jgi:CTP synthase (UTP-ammonia lyase)
LSPDFRDALADGPLRICAADDAGDVRGIELDGHPFFIATLFQHERGALQGRVSPPVRAFVQAMVDTY